VADEERSPRETMQQRSDVISSKPAQRSGQERGFTESVDIIDSNIGTREE
jgi:hypothetical protein